MQAALLQPDGPAQRPTLYTLISAQAERTPDAVAIWSGGSLACTPGFYAPRFFEWMPSAVR